jgi:hypothetical protein
MNPGKISVQFGMGMFFKIKAAEPAIINGISDIKPSLTAPRCRCDPILAPTAVILFTKSLIFSPLPPALTFLHEAPPTGRRNLKKTPVKHNWTFNQRSQQENNGDNTLSSPYYHNLSIKIFLENNKIDFFHIKL